MAGQARKGRKAPYILAGIVLLIIAAWSGAWFYASHRVDQAIAVWIQKQKARGTNIACERRTVSGYPFRLVVSCESLSIAASRNSTKTVLSLARVIVAAQVYNPRLIIAEAHSPFSLRVSGARNLSAESTWQNLRVSARISRPVPERISLMIEQPVARLTLPSGEERNIKAGQIQIHLRPAQDVTPRGAAMDLALAVAKANIPGANRLAGNDAPVDLQFTARTTAVPSLAVPGRLPERLERWRIASGGMVIRSVSVTKGKFQVTGSGRLTIDDERRPAGTIDARVRGIGQIARKLGLGLGPVNMGNLAAGLFGRKKSEAPEKPAGIAIPLPVMLRDGRVWIGPVKTGVRLRPLYPAP